MLSRNIFILLLVFVASWFLTIAVFSDEKTNKTNGPIKLGNPLLVDNHTGRALNVWDLQVFNQKIYLAGGSTVQNAGPINVWAYNPVIQDFVKEYQVDEEAIEHYRVFDNELYIPAADPCTGDANKFYRQGVNGQWRKYSSRSVSLAHVRDLVKTSRGDILMVGNNRQATDVSKPATAVTTDNGSSFMGAGLENIPLIGDVVLVDYNWFFSVFSYQDKIYAPTSILRDYTNFAGGIAVYNPQQKKFELNDQLKNDEFIPSKLIAAKTGTQGIDISYRIWSPVEYKNSLIYAVRSHSLKSNRNKAAYMNSLGMYVKKDLGITPFLVDFPDGNSIGEDLLVINNEIYALSNTRVSKNKFIIYVYKTDDPTNNDHWIEVLRFHSQNKARSFEYLDKTFYFGLGQDYGDPIGNSGDILSYTLK